MGVLVLLGHGKWAGQHGQSAPLAVPEVASRAPWQCPKLKLAASKAADLPAFD